MDSIIAYDKAVAANHREIVRVLHLGGCASGALRPGRGRTQR
jgi:hypothetical protein